MDLDDLIIKIFKDIPNKSGENYIRLKNAVVAIATILVLSFYYLIYYAFNNFFWGFVGTVFLFSSAFFSFLLLKKNKNFDLCTNILNSGVYLSITIKSLALGGLEYSGLFWIIFLPVLPVFLSGKRSSIYLWSFLAVITVPVLYISQFYISFKGEVSGSVVDSFIDIFALTGAMLFFVNYYNIITRDLINSLKKTGKIAEESVHNLSIATSKLEEDIKKRKLIEQELEKNMLYYQSVFENTGTGIILYDGNGIIKSCNSRFEQMSGFSREDLIDLKKWPSLVDKEDVSRMISFHDLRFERGEEVPGEYDFKFIKKNNDKIYVHVKVGVIREFDLRIASLIDISKRIKAEEELINANLELETIFNNSQVGIMLLKKGRFFFKGNKKLLDIFGYDDTKEMEKMSMKNLHLSEANYQEFGRRFYDTLVNGEQIQVEYQLKKKNNKPIWCSLSGKAIDNGFPPDLDKGVLWTVDDITQKKKNEFRLREMATRDELTGIYNRRQFMNVAEKEFNRSRRKNHVMSMLMIDADYFKKINDNYGHITGDETLKALASIGISCIRDIDIFGRIGGEEFAVLLPETDDKQALIVAERLRSSVENSELLVLDNRILKFTVSIGISSLSYSMSNVEDLMARADEALYQAKGEGRNRVVYRRR